MGGPERVPPNPLRFARGLHRSGAAARAARLLRLREQVRAAVLGPARLVRLRALRLFLAVGDDRDAAGLDAVSDEVVLGGLRAALAEREVVLHGAALVAVALDQHEVPRVRLQPIDVPGERRGLGGAEGVLVEVEVDGGEGASVRSSAGELSASRRSTACPAGRSVTTTCRRSPVWRRRLTMPRSTRRSTSSTAL